MIKVLIVGPTPPPYGGQAVMIKNLLDANYPDIKFYHVRATFSKDMSEIGKFSFSKVNDLIKMILKIIFIRIKHKVGYLYYGPGGPNFIPMYRDIIMLFFTRSLFKKTIFHFHAGSTYSLYHKIPRWVRFFFRKAYFNADIGIRVTKFNPPDPSELKAKREFIVSNGIYDDYKKYSAINERLEKKWPIILFVGNIFKEKGITELIEACHMLRNRNFYFKVNVIGRFQSTEFEMLIRHKIIHYGLVDNFCFYGVLVGNEKYKHYFNADIFCSPTYFETFGLTIAEAMQFSLPIVSTNVGGVPELVEDGVNGFLVDKYDVQDLADKLEILLVKPDERLEMGVNSREIFLKKFTIEKFHSNMEFIFRSLIQ
jgi:glycosyltransferase involved in cell wall biosynthesis